MIRTVKKWLGINILEAENLRLAKALKVQIEAVRTAPDWAGTVEDHEVRIAWCESQLTAKTSTARIVAKPQKRTFRQFAEAASKASETEETSE